MSAMASKMPTTLGRSCASIVASETELSSPSSPSPPSAALLFLFALGFDFFLFVLAFALGDGGRENDDGARLGLVDDRVAVGGVEIDDVAQQHLSFVERI